MNEDSKVARAPTTGTGTGIVGPGDDDDGDEEADIDLGGDLSRYNIFGHQTGAYWPIDSNVSGVVAVVVLPGAAVGLAVAKVTTFGGAESVLTAAEGALGRVAVDLLAYL